MRDDADKKNQNGPMHRAPVGSSRAEAVARTTSEALLGTARELIIEHHGREYRLRLTQQGKLILTA
jgi:hemin uptake protein HemP